MDINWLWLAVGLIPFSIKRQQTKDEQLICVRAFFWLLTIQWRHGQCSWEVSLPVIEHWRQERLPEQHPPLRLGKEKEE